MKSERVPGNYSILRYEEPGGTRRLVASYVLENAIAPDVYAALSGQAPSPWLSGSAADAPVLRAPGAPLPFEVTGGRPSDRVEYRVQGSGAVSTVVMTLAPAIRCTVVTACHSGIEVADEKNWQRFWCGKAFAELGEALHSGGAAAHPVLLRP
jgi:hypothetical protein